LKSSSGGVTRSKWQEVKIGKNTKKQKVLISQDGKWRKHNQPGLKKKRPWVRMGGPVGGKSGREYCATPEAPKEPTHDRTKKKKRFS